MAEELHLTRHAEERLARRLGVRSRQTVLHALRAAWRSPTRVARDGYRPGQTLLRLEHEGREAWVVVDVASCTAVTVLTPAQVASSVLKAARDATSTEAPRVGSWRGS